VTGFAAAAAYCTSSACSKKQWPAATCSKAQIHKSNSLQQISVYHTVHPSAPATFTGMTSNAAIEWQLLPDGPNVLQPV